MGVEVSMLFNFFEVFIDICQKAQKLFLIICYWFDWTCLQFCWKNLNPTDLQLDLNSTELQLDLNSIEAKDMKSINVSLETNHPLESLCVSSGIFVSNQYENHSSMPHCGNCSLIKKSEQVFNFNKTIQILIKVVQIHSKTNVTRLFQINCNHTACIFSFHNLSIMFIQTLTLYISQHAVQNWVKEI